MTTRSERVIKRLNTLLFFSLLALTLLAVLFVTIFFLNRAISTPRYQLSGTFTPLRLENGGIVGNLEVKQSDYPLAKPGETISVFVYRPSVPLQPVYVRLACWENEATLAALTCTQLQNP